MRRQAELAAGLRDVAETAPGIGLAADQLGRLSSAMAGVNQATLRLCGPMAVCRRLAILAKAGGWRGDAVTAPAAGVREGFA